ncbi:hypothetical protein [Halalkalibacter alkalisediminis]|uniref:Uncharacterized protein n=1 Tax=Halalkalibacter alkalisediminis TaxID=935616 RepID=A0ABV6NJ63_9BACI|nr:hypothetical protein [Halalkalibacter alkalisediminis]
MKKILLTTASAVLSLGILAACGDDGIDEPTLGGEEQDFEQEMEFDESEGTEEFDTDVEAEFDETEEFDTEFDAEMDETEEFDTEFDAETEDTEEDGL